MLSAVLVFAVLLSPTANAQAGAADDAFEVIAGSVTSLDVLANDRVDGPTITEIGTPRLGRVELDARTQDVIYTAPASFTTDTFTYTVVDSLGFSGTATVTITAVVVCDDVRVLASDGGEGLAAALAAANTCPGHQTISVDPGTYTLRSALIFDDETTLQATEADRPPVLQRASGTTGEIFYVADTRTPVVIRNVDTIGTIQVSLAFARYGDLTLEGVTYTEPDQFGCSIGIGHRITAQGSDLTIRNSRLERSSCGAINAFESSMVTIEDTEILGTGNSAVSVAQGTTLNVTRSTIAGAGSDGFGNGIDSRDSTTTVSDSYIVVNVTDGIYATGDLTVRDSFIGVGVNELGELGPGGNGGDGIESTFANLTLENTLVANNGNGLRAAGQSVWSTSITNSTIENNTGFGLQLNGSATGTASGTTLQANAPDCVLANAVLNDAGGNADSDGSCGFTPPDPCGLAAVGQLIGQTVELARLPFAVSDVCVVAPELIPSDVILEPGQTYVDLTGSYDLSFLAEAGVTALHDGAPITAENPLTLGVVVTSDGFAQPWDFGPIGLTFGPWTRGVAQVDGRIEIAGYTDGVFDGTVTGEGSVVAEGGGLVDGSVSATIDGSAFFDDNGNTVIDLTASFDAELVAGRDVADTTLVALDRMQGSVTAEWVNQFDVDTGGPAAIYDVTGGSVEIIGVSLSGAGTISIPSDDPSINVFDGQVEVQTTSTAWEFTLLGGSSDLTWFGSAVGGDLGVSGSLSVALDEFANLTDLSGDAQLAGVADLAGTSVPLTLAFDVTGDSEEANFLATAAAGSSTTVVGATAIADQLVVQDLTVSAAGGLTLALNTGEVLDFDVRGEVSAASVVIENAALGFDASVTGFAGTIDGSGLVATATAIDGSFGPFDIAVTDGASLHIGATGDEPFVTAASGQVTRDGATLSVTNLVVQSDGDVDFDGLCAGGLESLASDRQMLLGLFPFVVTEACLYDAKNAPVGVRAGSTYATIRGEFDLSALPEVGAYLSLDGQRNGFTDLGAVLHPDGTFDLWNTGTIEFGFGPASQFGFSYEDEFGNFPELDAGLTAQASMQLGGWVNGGWQPNFVADASGSIELPYLANLAVSGDGRGQVFFAADGSASFTGVLDLTGSGAISAVPHTAIELSEIEARIIVSLWVQLIDGEPVLRGVIDFDNASGSGELRFVDGDGTVALSTAIGVGYRSGDWTFEIAGSAGNASSDLDWLTLTEGGGTIYLTLTDIGGSPIGFDGEFAFGAEFTLPGGSTVDGTLRSSMAFEDGLFGLELSGSLAAPAELAVDGIARIVEPHFAFGGSMTYDTISELFVATDAHAELVSATEIVLFESVPGAAATATNVSGRLDRSGLSVMSGTVGGTFTTPTGTVEMTADAVTLSFDGVDGALFTATSATITEGDTTFVATDVVVFDNGSIEIGAGCGANPGGLFADGFGVAGVLPLDVTEVCVIANASLSDELRAALPDGATYAVIDGTFDLSGIAALDPYVLIDGDGGVEGTFAGIAAIWTEAAGYQLWNTGTIEVGYGPVTVNGVTTNASISLGGYDSGSFDPAVAGTAAGTVDLPGIGSAALSGDITGTISVSGADETYAATFDATASIAAGAEVALDSALVAELSAATVDLAVSLRAQVVAGELTVTGGVQLIDASGTATVSFADDDGTAVVEAEVAVDYTSGVWTLTGSGIAGAATSDLEWMALSSVDGAMTIDTTGDTVVIDGQFSAATEVVFPSGETLPGQLTATLGFDGTSLTLALSGQASTRSLTVDGIATFTGLDVSFGGSASYDVADQTFAAADAYVSLDRLDEIQLFVGKAEDGFDVTVTGVTGRLDRTGLTLEADEITGTFGNTSLSDGLTTLTMGPATLTLDGIAGELLTVDEAILTEPGGTTVTLDQVTIFDNGTIRVGSGCADNPDGLFEGTLGIAGLLPFDVTHVCLYAEGAAPDDVGTLPTGARYAELDGTFDLSGIAELNPSVSIGGLPGGTTGTFEDLAFVLLGDGTIGLWNTGTVELGIGPVTTGGLTVQGSLFLGGYDNGSFDGDFSGSLSAALDLPGVTTSDLTMSTAGTVAAASPTSSVSGTATVVAAAVPDTSSLLDNLGRDGGVVSLDELSAELAFAITATETADGWDLSAELNLLSASVGGFAGFSAGTTEDGPATLMGIAVVGDYNMTEAGVWTFEANGSAAATSADWATLAEVTGSLRIDTNPSAAPIVDGLFGAEATLDLDGDPTTDDRVSVAAEAAVTYDGRFVRLDVTSETAAPVDVTVDGFLDVSGLGVRLEGGAQFDTFTNTAGDFTLSATVSADSATLFPGKPEFTVTVTDFSGTVDGRGLDVTAASINGQFGLDEDTGEAITLDVDNAQLTILVDDEILIRADRARLEEPGGGFAEVNFLRVFRDGRVTFTEGCVGNADGVFAGTFGIAGVLPFDVVEACAISEDAGRTLWSVQGTFDLSKLEAAFGEGSTLTMTVGDENSHDGAGVPNTFFVEFESFLDGDQLVVRPTEFGPATLTVDGAGVGPFAGEFAITIGGYQNGVLAGVYTSGTVPADPTPMGTGSFAVDLDLTGEDPDADIGAGLAATIGAYLVVDESVTTLVIGGEIAGSGSLLVDDVGLSIDGASVDFDLRLAFDPTTLEPVGAPQVAFSADAHVDVLTLGVGFAIIEATDVALFPAPDVFADVGELSLTFTDTASALAGWGGSVSDIRILFDADSQRIDVCALENFGIAFTAEGAPAIFDWMPLTIESADLVLPDYTPDPRCDSVIDRLGQYADAKLSATIGLGGLDQWPFEASVRDISVDLSLLPPYLEWLANPEGPAPAFPITDLDELTFGVAPTDFGPLTLGGLLTIGKVNDSNGFPVWYGRLAAAGEWNDIGMSFDIGVSQNGPMWASVSTPLIIALGPTGFTISGVGGGLSFDQRFPSIGTDCSRDGAGEASCVGAEALVDLQVFELSDNAPETSEDLRTRVLARANSVAGAETPLEQIAAFIPTSFTINLHGTLNHATGLFKGKVTLGANVDGNAVIDGSGALPDVQLIGKGDLAFFGFEVGEVGLLMDFENPVDPVWAVALKIPGDGGLQDMVLDGPVEAGAVFTGTYDSKGIYSAVFIVGRELARTLIVQPESFPGGTQVLDDLAARLDYDRSRPLAQMVLEGEPADAVIDTALLVRRLDELIPPTETDAALLEEQLLNDGAALSKVAGAFITEVFDALANGKPIVPGDTTPYTPPTVTIDEATAAFADLARSSLLDTDGAANRSLETLLAVVDPSLRVTGAATFELFGVKVGPQQEVEITVDKSALAVAYEGSIPALIDPALSVVWFDQSAIDFQVPWELDDLVASGLQGDFAAVGVIDPFTGDWNAKLDSEGMIAGLPYSAFGLIAPAGQADWIAEQLAAGGAVPSDAKVEATLLANGGAFVAGDLRLPAMLADPADLIEGPDGLLALGCLDIDFENLTNNLEPLLAVPACLELVTETVPLATVEGYGPNPLGGRADLTNAYLQGQLEDFELFGFPVVAGDNPSFTIDEKGITLTGEVQPFLERVDEFTYIMNARLPFIGDGSPEDRIPLQLRVVEIGDLTNLDGFVPSRELLDLDVSGTRILVPRLGGEYSITGSQIASLLDEVGLNVPSIAGRTTFELAAYTPSYSLAPEAPELQRTGGVELSAIANLDGAFNGLIEMAPGDTASVTLRVTPPTKDTDLFGTVTATIEIDGDMVVGGVTITDGTIAVDSTATASFEGTIEVPTVGSFTVNNGTFELDPRQPSAEFTLAVDQATIGAVTLDGSLTVFATPTSWELELLPRTGDLAVVRVDGWGEVGVAVARIDSGGAFDIDLELGDLGTVDDLLSIAGLGMQVQREANGTMTGGLRGLLRISLDNGVEPITVDLATIGIGRIPLVSGGDFEHTFSDEFAIGDVPIGTAALTIGRNGGTWYAELDADSEPLSGLGLTGSIELQNLRVEARFADAPRSDVIGVAEEDGLAGGFARLGLAAGDFGSIDADLVDPIGPGIDIDAFRGLIDATVEGTAVFALTEPLSATVFVEIDTVTAHSGRRVVQFTQTSAAGPAASWIRTDGSWFLDLDSLPSVRLIDGASPIRLISGTLAAEPASGEPASGGVDVAFTGVVAVDGPFDTTFEATGFVNTANETFELAVTSPQLPIGPVSFSGGVSLQKLSPFGPARFEIVEASTVTVDGWGEVELAGTNFVQTNGAFTLAFETPDLGSAGDLAWIEEPRLLVQRTGAGSIDADLAGTLHLGPNNEFVFDLADLPGPGLAIGVVDGGDGSFSGEFTRQFEFGVFAFGTTSFGVERTADGAFFVTVDADASLEAFPTLSGTVALDNVRFGLGAVAGTAELTMVTLVGPVNGTASVRTLSDGVLEVRIGNSYVRSDGGSDISLFALFESSAETRTSARTFVPGGTTSITFDVDVVSGAEVDYCRVNGVIATESSTVDGRFTRSLGEGTHAVRCGASKEFIDTTEVFGISGLPETITRTFTQTDVLEFNIVVIRDLPTITFEQPNDVYVNMDDLARSGAGARFFYPPFDVTNAQVTCDPAGGFLVAEPTTFVATCTASNIYESAPVTRTFPVEIGEIIDLGWSMTVDVIGLATTPIGDDGKTQTSQDTDMRLTGDGTEPGSWVEAALFSDPLVVGETISDADGSWEIRFTVPADFPLGDHTLAVYATDAQGRTRASFAALEVLPVGVIGPPTLAERPLPYPIRFGQPMSGGDAPSDAAAPEPLTDGDAPGIESISDSLAFTGTNSPLLAYFGLLLLSTGCTLCGLSRRRRTK